MKIIAGKRRGAANFGILLALTLYIILITGVHAEEREAQPAPPASVSANAKVSAGIPTITGPLSLRDAVQTALSYSPMVRAAGAQSSAAQSRVGISRAMTRPQVAVSGFAGTSTMGDIITSPPGVMQSSVFGIPGKGSVTGQVGLMYPLYTGGRLSSAVRGSEALSEAAASDRATIERNAALETKVTYHRALLAQSTVDVYGNYAKEAQERVRIAEVAFREGKIAKYDLLRNQAELAEAEQQLANAERDAQIALIDLKTVMGVSQKSDIALSDKLAYSQVQGDPDAYMDTAIKNRPELTAARAKVNSGRANVDVAKSAYKPQVYANAMQGLSAVSGGTESGFTAGLSVGLPLVDGGLRRSQVREAESMLEAMQRDEQQAQLAVQQDVSTVWAELQAADRNVTLSETAVEQAQEDYRVIKLRYEAGKAINVEVLDALAALVRAQNNQLVALYEHNVARDRLARAIGEL